MVIVGLFSWWYGAGWIRCVSIVRDMILSMYDFFSLDLLLRTLFSPFRQISAGKVRGPIGVQLRAFADNLISRIIGGIIRSIVLVVGVLTIFAVVCIGVVRVLLWPIVPVLPIVGLVLGLSGWVPWQI